MRLRPTVGTLLIVALSWAGRADAAYLPAAADLPKAVNVIDPQTSDTHIITQYVGGLQTFTTDVFCPGTTTKIGKLDFEFAGYEGRRAADPAGGGNTIGGTAIRGGFIATDPACDGYTYRWLQTYIDQPAGGPNTSVVDGSPFYPDFPIAGVTAALFDVPFDLLTRNIRVSFQSGLVCVDNANPNNVKYIGTFLWAYSIAGGVVTPEAPSNWGPPTANWLATIRAAYPAMNLSEGCCCVPEPSSCLLIVLGLAVAETGRRAKNVKDRKRVAA